MRVVFMGTPAFAVPSLRALAAHHDVVAVYTQPDRPVGRGRCLAPSQVKEAALALDLVVRQPSTLRESETVASLSELAPDVICVAAYGLILPPDVLGIPRHGCINVHASLLPRHRGAAPVHSAILEGDEVTGVSIMRMEEGLDTGPVASTVTVSVGELDVDELTARLAEEGAAALLTVIDEVSSGRVKWVAQDDQAATYAAKVTRADVALHPDLTVEQALRRVRASTRSAPSRLTVGEHAVTVVSASRTNLEVPPGIVHVTKRELVLGVADGAIALDEIRPEGRGCMDGACFARGSDLGERPTWEAHT